MAKIMILIILRLHFVVSLFGACLNGYVRYENSCYHLGNDVEPWVNGMDVCKLDHGYLAEVGSAKENSFLKQLLNGKSVTQAWIGGADLNVEGDWLWWTSRTKMAFSNWNPNEPNNSGDEDCLLIQAGGTWNDGHCKNDAHYICEMPYDDATQVVG